MDSYILSFSSFHDKCAKKDVQKLHGKDEYENKYKNEDDK